MIDWEICSNANESAGLITSTIIDNTVYFKLYKSVDH